MSRLAAKVPASAGRCRSLALTYGKAGKKFRSGAQYLLFMHQPVEEFRKEDLKSMGLPQGTLGVWLGCGEVATLSEAGGTVKRLGRSKPPRR